MFETVNTNGAAILMMIGLWSTLSSLVTYMVVSYRRQQEIDVLDHHLREADDLISQLLYDEHGEGYAEYVLDENGNWHESN